LSKKSFEITIAKFPQNHGTGDMGTRDSGQQTTRIGMDTDKDTKADRDTDTNRDADIDRDTDINRDTFTDRVTGNARDMDTGKDTDTDRDTGTDRDRNTDRDTDHRHGLGYGYEKLQRITYKKNRALKAL
jgi:hypothetical protein